MFSQNRERSFSQNMELSNEGIFKKLVEYSLLIEDSVYNHNSKDALETRFWGVFNAPIEFFYENNYEILPLGYARKSGFRILADSAKTSYTLEIKFVTNADEAFKIADAKTKPFGQLDARNFTEDEFSLLIKNREDLMRKWLKEETCRLYDIEEISFPISKQFAEKLNEKMFSVINKYNTRGLPPTRTVHGFNVTFRTVIDNVVWSLNITTPYENTRKMADTCIQMIVDAMANNFDETKYIKLLDDIL